MTTTITASAWSSVCRSARALGVAAAAACLLCGAAARAAERAALPGSERATIRFEGNKAFSSARLRAAAADELRAFAESGLRRADVDDAAFTMETMYRAAGYAFASVAYRLEESAAGTLAVFTISEGPRVRLGKISVEGNTAFRTEQIRALFTGASDGALATGLEIVRKSMEILMLEEDAGAAEGVYVASGVSSAVSRLRDLYRERGFLDVRIGEPRTSFSPDRKEASLALTIEEGARHVVERVVFSGTVPEQARQALDRAAREFNGTPDAPGRETLLRSRILEIYGNLGYPAATVEVRRETAGDPAQVVLAADIASGPRVLITGIEVSGNVKTRAGYIRSLLTFKSGEYFRRDRERESFSALYGTGLFSKVSVELGGEADADRRPALVHVQEAPSREFILEGGWGSYEQLRGRLGYRQKNLFGRGREAGAEIGASLKGEDILLSLREPRFLGSAVSASLPLTFRRREEPAFTRSEFALSTVFAADLGARTSGTLEYRYTFTDLFDVAPGFAVEDLDTVYNLTTVKAQATRDTRDDIFFPGSGHRLSAAAELADPLLGGDLAFLHLSAGARFFHTLFRRTVVGLRFDTGLILPMRDEISIPLGERLYNGGENTVRSFREGTVGPRLDSGEPAGGLASNVLSLEMRRRFGANLAATVFLDYGNVAPNRTRQEQGLEPFASRSDVVSATLSDQFRGFRPAVGVGVQYLLPVGPLRLDLAFNPDVDRDRGESASTLHFSVGAAF